MNPESEPTVHETEEARANANTLLSFVDDAYHQRICAISWRAHAKEAAFTRM